MILDQKSFERGLDIGLRTAVVIVRQGGGLGGILAQIDEIKEMQALRDGGDFTPVRRVEAGDIFSDVPLIHPGDIGQTATEGDDERARLSRLAPRISLGG